MKKILLIALLFITVTANAQTNKPIDSFLGVKFGSTRAQVIAGLKLKGGSLNKTDGDANTLIFDNIKLAGRQTAYLYVSFVGAKASEAGFVFKPELEAQTIEFYNNLVADIISVYGQGTPTKEFKEPYEAGDGYEVTAIELGKAKFNTIWGMKDKNQPGAVLAMITSKLLVTITYRDKKLAEIEDQHTKAKNNSEF